MDTVLRELVTPKFIALYVYIAMVCYVHFRGKVRLRFGRQFFEHSGLLAPFNILMYGFSAVPNKPVLDVKRFPQLNVFRENWEVIRDEAKALYEGGGDSRVVRTTTTWRSSRSTSAVGNAST